jgi:preprotein translocase subunit SecG
MNIILMIFLILTAIFLIVLILVQRGKGGGLAGAFGGMGGQSAFGTKAGDLFTKITIGVAAFWIVLCIVSIKLLDNQSGMLNPNMGGAAQQQKSAPASTDKQAAPDAGQPGQETPAAPNKTP